MRKMENLSGLTALGVAMLLGVSACGSDGYGPSSESESCAGVEAPEIYSFESRFEPGESSVSYSGQTFRQVLVQEMVNFISGLTEEIDSGDFVPAPGEVYDSLNYFFAFDSDTSGDDLLTISTTPETLQVTFADISSGKDLVSKIVGNDSKGQHKDWSESFVGWNGVGGDSPESLVLAFFQELDDLAVARANGEIPLAPDGTPVENVYVTADGRDLKQLIQKFLLMAVNFSQGTDDYLDNDLDGQGLNSDNVDPAGEGSKYTNLEHKFDEGFGYFGAARDYLNYTDDEIAGKGGRSDYETGSHDTNGDGKIDLKSETNFSASVNAGKRDRGSSDENPTDFSKDGMEGFLCARAIIDSAEGALSDEQMDALIEARDQAVLAWEKAIAATVVHYINDTLADMESASSGDYDFANHSKHWSEMKGFALGLQFNPHSPLSDADFASVQEFFGDMPALPNSPGFDAYAEGLLAARVILGDAYGFAESNITGW